MRIYDLFCLPGGGKTLVELTATSLPPLGEGPIFFWLRLIPFSS